MNSHAKLMVVFHKKNNYYYLLQFLDREMVKQIASNSSFHILFCEVQMMLLLNMLILVCDTNVALYALVVNCAWYWVR